MSEAGSPLTPPQPAEGRNMLAAIIDSVAPMVPPFMFRDAVRIADAVIGAGWRPPAEGRPELIEKAAKALGKLPIDEPWPGFITPEIIERHMMWATRLDHVGLLAGPAPLRQLAGANARIGRLEELFNESRRDAMRVIRALGLGEDDALDDVVAHAKELFDRPLRQGEGDPGVVEADILALIDVLIEADQAVPNLTFRYERMARAVVQRAGSTPGAGLLATTPPTPDPLRRAHEYGVTQRAALLDRVQETACDRRSTTPPTQPAGRADLLADQTGLDELMCDLLRICESDTRPGWEVSVLSIREAEDAIADRLMERFVFYPKPDVTPSGVDVQSPTENESPRAWRCPPPPGVDHVRDSRGLAWQWQQPYWHHGKFWLSGIDLATLHGPLTELKCPSCGSWGGCPGCIPQADAEAGQ